MDFIAELQELHNVKSVVKPRCSVHHVLESLPEAERDALLAALDNKQIRHTDLATVLQNRGFIVSAITVSRHRNRGESSGCRCPR